MGEYPARVTNPFKLYYSFDAFRESRNNTITRLRLKVVHDNNGWAGVLSSFINKFRENVPDLHTVELVVKVRELFVSSGVAFKKLVLETAV